MSLESTQSPASPDSHQDNVVTARPRKPSAESNIARNRREAIALDGLMFESGSAQDELATASLAQSELSNAHVDDQALKPSDPSSNDMEAAAAAISLDSTANVTDRELDGPSQKTVTESHSPTSSTSSPPSSPDSTPGTPESLSGPQQSMFLGDHITLSHDVPIIKTSSDSPGSNDDQEDMKEVQIETDDPSHLFWVPFHLHPEIAPNEYNQWLEKHGSPSETLDGTPSSRKSSVSRRKSVLSAQYNPEDDLDDPPSNPLPLPEKTSSHDFLGVFSALEQLGDLPLKSKTSLRRSVSLSVSSPTRAEFPMDTIEEDLIAAKRTGGLEKGGLSLLRRSARTKIRRNSSASNGSIETRPDLTRLRQTVNANGEYTPVSLVDHGPQPLPSVMQAMETAASATEDTTKSRKEAETVPVKRFVSTLRDPSKPTITTYIEPQLLEQKRRELEEANKEDEVASPSFRISAPGKLESPVEGSAPTESTESERKEKPDNFTVSYPIPPPVKLTQNLLQQSAGQPSPGTPSPQSPSAKSKQPGQSGHTHAKKPSTWQRLWGKEKGNEKSAEPSAANPNGAPPPSQAKPVNPSQPPTSPESSTQASSAEVTVKKQSTLSMLFSRNGKSTSSKSSASSGDLVRTGTGNGYNGQSSPNERPKYSNYNRFPIHIERAIYRLSHVKLANPRRPLQEQVLISNMMFWYLGVIQQQQAQQQQQEMQQRQLQDAQQKEANKGSDSKEDGKESKSKKPKKRKSQKKKNQQRSTSKTVERITSGPEQHQHYQHQRPAGGSNAGNVARPRQQGASLPSSHPAQKEGRKQGNQQIESDQDSDESEGESVLEQQQLQYNAAAPTPNSAVGSQDDEEDDDVPLAHYQNVQRQAVSVS
ncbi:hypothetical protein BGX31_003917 [Mortierella sp. GBA43]|nr:hypothetical protein BGX31_003917 [Mortierella sp. GBA43]